MCTKRTWPTQSDLKVFNTTIWKRTLWYNLAKLHYKDGEKDEVQRRGEHRGNLVNPLETLWEHIGTPKKPKTFLPPKPKRSPPFYKPSHRLHENFIKIFLVTIFTWANGKHREYGCKFIF